MNKKNISNTNQTKQPGHENIKLNCNIIKDLLPSYLEEICTPDTRHAVTEHLAACPGCRSLKDLLQKTELVAEQTERAEINSFKKLKNHFIKKGSFSTFILSAFVLLGFLASLRDIGGFQILPVYYVFLPVLLILTRLLLPAPLGQKQSVRKQAATVLLSLAGTFYGVLLLSSCLTQLQQGRSFHFGPFELMPQETGPFLYWQFAAIICLQTGLYLAGLLRAFTGKTAEFICMGIYLTGGFIMLSQITLLRSLSDFATAFQSMLRSSAVLIAESLILIFLLSVSSRIRQHRS